MRIGRRSEAFNIEDSIRAAFTQASGSHAALGFARQQESSAQRNFELVNDSYVASVASIVTIASLLVFGSLGGCAMEQKQAMKEASTSNPVDYRTAEGDIRILQNEKAYLVERAAEGFTAVTPAGAILGVLSGTELSKVEVAIGVYDAKLDERVAQIRAQCGL